MIHLILNHRPNRHSKDAPFDAAVAFPEEENCLFYDTAYAENDGMIGYKFLGVHNVRFEADDLTIPLPVYEGEWIDSAGAKVVYHVVDISSDKRFITTSDGARIEARYLQSFNILDDPTKPHGIRKE